jgi:aspartyl-tRNA(Asn)/glutamyl-tRNA(Gln) amidotransferase subunit A
MSMPAGFSASGLPLSVQIVGRAFDDPTVLRIGASLEAMLGLTSLRPALPMKQAA